GADDGVAVADFATRGVHEIRATLHFGEKLVIEQALGLRMKRRVDRDDVANLDHVLDIGMPCEIEFLFDRFRQSMPIEIVQMHVEGLEATQHCETDPASSDGSDMHSLDVVGTRDAIRDVPTAL